MAESLKKQTVKGVVWSGLEKTVTYIVTFVVSIVMARMLTPADYGVVGIIMVFVSFSQLFIDGGFTTALIAKADRDEKDFQTVFVFNFLAAVVLYALLFLAAPFIEKFYAIDGLGQLLRVFCLNLIVTALSSIQITKFTIAADFKTISKISVPSGIISGLSGILMAYLGCGVWSLVFSNIINAAVRVLLALLYSKWIPKLYFSRQSFKTLFGFSYKLLVSNLIDKVYSNAYPLFIGKFFPPATLGNYSRGEHFGKLPASIITEVFSRVTFPLMSSIQNDNNSLRAVYRKYIRLSSFVVFPVMMLVCVCAEPIVRILLTDKWLDCVIYVQLLSMSMMFAHINNINLNLLYVKQHSDWALKLELIKKGLAISLFLISTHWGVIGVCMAQLIYGMISPSLNSVYTNRLIGLNYGKQIGDYIGLWLLSVIIGVLPLWIESLIDNALLQLLVGAVSYLALYLIVNTIFNRSDLKAVLVEGKSFFAHK